MSKSLQGLQWTEKWHSYRESNSAQRKRPARNLHEKNPVEVEPVRTLFCGPHECSHANIDPKRTSVDHIL